MDKRTFFAVAVLALSIWVGRFLIYFVSYGAMFAQQAFGNVAVQLTSLIVILTTCLIMGGTKLRKYVYAIPFITAILGCLLFAVQRLGEIGAYPTLVTMALTAGNWIGAGLLGAIGYGLVLHIKKDSVLSS